jgi:chromosome segregation ATPase
VDADTKAKLRAAASNARMGRWSAMYNLDAMGDAVIALLDENEAAADRERAAVEREQRSANRAIELDRLQAAQRKLVHERDDLRTQMANMTDRYHEATKELHTALDRIEHAGAYDRSRCIVELEKERAALAAKVAELALERDTWRSLHGAVQAQRDDLRAVVARVQELPDRWRDYRLCRVADCIRELEDVLPKESP